MSAELQDPRFTDETAAREALEKIVWPNGPVCPHCGNADAAKIAKLETKTARPGLRYCNECKGQFTATVGTIFERSKIPLTKWWLAAHLIGSSKKGISSHQLHRMLGVSYKSTWFMMHRIREAMRVGGLAPMGGEGSTVEIDETFIGKQRWFEAKPGWVHIRTRFSRSLSVAALPVRSISTRQPKKTSSRSCATNLDRESHVDDGRSSPLSKHRRGVRHAWRRRPFAQGIRLHGPRDRRENQHEHGRRLLLDFQARHEGRLPALRREAPSPLSRRVRFPLFEPLSAGHRGRGACGEDR